MCIFQQARASASSKFYIFEEVAPAFRVERIVHVTFDFRVEAVSLDVGSELQ